MKTFKKIWITLLLTLGILALCNAQEERFTVGIYLEPQHFNILSTNTDALIHFKKPDGFNIGAHVELQGKHLYIRARTFLFPNLNNIPYFDVDGGAGVHWRSFNDKSRIYAGGFIGLIYREVWGHNKSGVEIGYDYYFDEKFYVGVKLDHQYKHDDKIWRHNASGHSVASAGIIIGYKLN